MVEKQTPEERKTEYLDVYAKLIAKTINWQTLKNAPVNKGAVTNEEAAEGMLTCLEAFAQIMVDVNAEAVRLAREEEQQRLKLASDRIPFGISKYNEGVEAGKKEAVQSVIDVLKILKEKFESEQK